jgi:Na+/H+-dicarboxylate symporter
MLKTPLRIKTVAVFYGFPLEALSIISMLGILIDPIATMINSSGDTIASMIVSRLLGNDRGND